MGEQEGPAYHWPQSGGMFFRIHYDYSPEDLEQQSLGFHVKILRGLVKNTISGISYTRSWRYHSSWSSEYIFPTKDLTFLRGEKVFVCLAVLGFELKVSHMLGRCSTTLAMSPPLKKKL
jgi:hypothetical protein